MILGFLNSLSKVVHSEKVIKSGMEGVTNKVKKRAESDKH